MDNLKRFTLTIEMQAVDEAAMYDDLTELFQEEADFEHLKMRVSALMVEEETELEDL